MGRFIKELDVLPRNIEDGDYIIISGQDEKTYIVTAADLKAYILAPPPPAD